MIQSSPPPGASVFRTEFMGYAVEFNPFDGASIAVATAQHFGVIGTGRLHVLSSPEPGAPVGMRELSFLESKDGLYDCAWSEVSPVHLVAACADGSVLLVDTIGGNVVHIMKGHSAEVNSVDWNMLSKAFIVSGSWDGSACVWDPQNPHTPLMKCIKPQAGCVYDTKWSPRDDPVFASVAGDCSVSIWDINVPHQPVQSFRAHNNEILTCDWNKYRPHCLVTGSVDRTIRVWDLRNPSVPVKILHGHEFAVRRVKCSPHAESLILSGSYDMSVRLWDESIEDGLVARFDHHTEFVVGLGFNLFREGMVATASWDESVSVFPLPRR